MEEVVPREPEAETSLLDTFSLSYGGNYYVSETIKQVYRGFRRQTSFFVSDKIVILKSMSHLQFMTFSTNFFFYPH